MQKLYDVVFGQNEFEKTKIEVRFEIIETLLTTLSISSLDDFEYLESCLYKIKDQLRVKSSNLNKVIKDSQKSLTKKKVLFVVEHLMELRNKFLNNAFSSLSQPITLEKKEIINENQLKKQDELLSQETLPETVLKEISQEEVGQEEISKREITSKKEMLTINPLLFENDDYSIILSTTSSPYLKVQFSNHIDFILLRDLSSLLFNEMKAHGSTIVIEGKKALIVPRFIHDTIMTPLSQDNGIDVDVAFSKVSSFLKNKSTSNIQTLPSETYRELDNSNIKRESTNKEKEDSLDSLLSSIEEKNVDPTPKPNPSKDSSAISIQKSDSIEIEEKPPQIFDNEIKIIKDSPEEKPIFSNEEELSDNNKKTLIYMDDQIKVHLNPNSKILGEIIIEHRLGKVYEELSEQELSYISIFSKIFSTIIFETLQAHGTNIFWSTKGKSLHILPRFQNDALNFQWNPQKHGDDFLEQIKNKLLAIMSKSLDSKDNTTTKEEETRTPLNTEKESNNLKKKAEYILSELRKIP